MQAKRQIPRRSLLGLSAAAGVAALTPGGSTVRAKEEGKPPVAPSHPVRMIADRIVRWQRPGSCS